MEARPRARLSVGAVVAAGVLVSLVASQPASPFTPPLYPDAGAPGWLRVPGTLIGLGALDRPGLALVGVVAIFGAAAAFLAGLRAAWRRDVSVRTVVLVTLLLHVLAFAMPVFLSRDVYSYAIYGRMVSHHDANPYVDLPAEFPDDPTYERVSVDWIDSKSVYGPAFTALSSLVTRVATTPAAIVMAFKALAVLASVGTVLLVLAAARRMAPGRAAFAGALIGWNPVVVFHGVAGGHNDALVGLAVAASALAILSRRERSATAALALGTLVKVSGAIPLAMAVAGAVARRARDARWRTLAVHVAIAAAVALPFVVPFLQTEDPTLGTLELAQRQGWLAPSRFVIATLGGLARTAGSELAADIVSLVVRVAFPLVFVWTLVGIVRHLARRPDRVTPEVVLAAMGWAGLVSILVAPVLFPWYAAWVLPLAWFLPRPARGGAVLLSLALAITELVAEPSRSPGVYEAMVFGLHWIAAPAALVVLIRLLLELRRRFAAEPGEVDALLADDVPSAARREDVAGSGEQQHAEQGADAAGKRPDPVGGDRAEDRHADPR